ncbi:hypothetical protein NDU88_006665 [Pleurodeles waltl]|uniref:Uncharacterized protein n=1 Tax=Pleurodeles waltl TaxID=8319 RepID=A0AAV7RQ40_PLEWA|nr:hypothetical protein NDU88_006665 [Pleurodeles waltl]
MANLTRKMWEGRLPSNAGRVRKEEVFLKPNGQNKGETRTGRKRGRSVEEPNNLQRSRRERAARGEMK